MANFLNRLASRAIGLAPVAKPVVPSVFSPALGLASSGPSHEPGSEVMLDPVERSTQSESTAVTHPSSPFQSEKPRDPFERNIRSQVAPEATLPTMDAAVADRSSSFGDFSSARAEKPLEHSVLTKRAVAAQPAESSTGFVAIRESRSPEINPDAPSRISSPPLPPAPRSVSASHSANSHGESPQPALFQALTKPRAQSEPSDAYENESPEAPRSRRRAEFEPSPAALTPIAGPVHRQAPVIRVTIGRIDVRAQFPSPPASSESKRRTRPAATPLNEYLKQRSEGKR